MLNRPRTAVVLLALASSVVQGLCIARAVTPAQDSVRLAGMAAQVQREGLARAIARGTDPPLFPLAALGARRLVDIVAPDAPSRWALAVQWAAAAALVASVVPVYCLARRVFGSAAALLAGSVWCILPEVCRLGADGLADSTQLACFAASVWCAANYFAPRHTGDRQPVGQLRWLFACGGMCGLAMLARSESILLLPAVFAALIAHEVRAVGTRLVGGAALLAGVALVWTPYLYLSNARSPGEMAARTMGRFDGVAAAGGFLGQALAAGPSAPNLTDTNLPTAGGPLLVFPHKDASHSLRVYGWLPAGRELIRELAQAWCYWIGGLALAGMWLTRGRLPGWYTRLGFTLTALLLTAVLTTSARWGYLSTRHLLLLVPLGVGHAGVALSALWTANWWGGAGRVAVVACLAGCLAGALGPRHESRLVHRQAAEWLLEHAAPRARVLDTRGWTALYSGRDTYRFTAARAALLDPRLAYVVVQRHELERDSPRAASLRWTLQRYAEPAARFGGGDRAVEVHRWHAERFAAAAAANALAN